MKLGNRELATVNSRAFKLFQKYLELPIFTKLGLKVKDRHILEIGCGSGHMAMLLSGMNPQSYMQEKDPS